MRVKNNFYRDIKLFPAILIFCWIFTVARLIYIATYNKEPLFVISCIAVVTVSLYGFCNFIAYWITMRYQYKKEDSDKSPNNVNPSEMHAISQHEDSCSEH